jgi:hypothetical protein
MRRGVVGARAGLKVGHKVLYIVTNVIGGKTSINRFEAEVLELPRPHLAKISLSLHGKLFTPTVKRSHLEYPSDVPKPTAWTADKLPSRSDPNSPIFEARRRRV